MRKPKRCGKCGSNEVVALNKNHEVALPWKDFPSVLLQETIEGWICSNCNEVIFSAAQGKNFDKIIKRSVTTQVNYFIQKIVEREKCEQRDIASHLGISPEYLSEIKSGRKIPKFQTFNFLKTLAYDKKSFEISSPSFRGIKIA